MFADLCGFEYGEFVHSTVDSHIYEDQIESIEEYLSRSEMPSPTLKLFKVNNWEEYNMNSFILDNYHSHPHIKIPVAV